MEIKLQCSWAAYRKKKKRLVLRYKVEVVTSHRLIKSTRGCKAARCGGKANIVHTCSTALKECFKVSTGLCWFKQRLWFCFPSPPPGVSYFLRDWCWMCLRVFSGDAGARSGASWFGGAACGRVTFSAVDFTAGPSGPGALCSSWNTCSCDRCRIKRQAPPVIRPLPEIPPLSLRRGFSSGHLLERVSSCSMLVHTNQWGEGLRGSGYQSLSAHVHSCLHRNTCKPLSSHFSLMAFPLIPSRLEPSLHFRRNGFNSVFRLSAEQHYEIITKQYFGDMKPFRESQITQGKMTWLYPSVHRGAAGRTRSYTKHPATWTCQICLHSSFTTEGIRRAVEKWEKHFSLRTAIIVFDSQENTTQGRRIDIDRLALIESNTSA